MAYLIGQIWLLIAASVVVGFVLGWLLGEATRAGSGPGSVRAHEDEMAAVRERLDQMLEQDEQRAAELHRLTDEKTSLENQLSMLGARLREAQARAVSDEGPDDATPVEESTDVDAPSASAEA